MQGYDGQPLSKLAGLQSRTLQHSLSGSMTVAQTNCRHGVAVSRRQRGLQGSVDLVALMSAIQVIGFCTTTSYTLCLNVSCTMANSTAQSKRAR